jgi:hypothetical protein
MVFFTLWRVLLAALIALLFARVDAYVEKRGWGDTVAGRAYRLYRQRGKKPRP